MRIGDPTRARDLARHFSGHAPEGSEVGEVMETMTGGAFIVEHDGARFAVMVIPQDEHGPLKSYMPGPGRPDGVLT
jgi:hypothetical protein